MPGLTNAGAKATLDARFPTTGGTDYIAYSIDGSTEWAGLARTAVGATGWAAATIADPSVKASANLLTTAAATATTTNATIYWAVMTASTAGAQHTDWQAITDNAGAARTFTLAIGDRIEHVAGILKVTLT